MKSNKFSFNRLLENNKLMFVVSVIISLVIWIYMSTGATNDTTVTITNIPIQIELSDEAKANGLTVFSESELTASVTVTGNRAVLGSIAASDVTVTAVATSVNVPGEYQLAVNATKKNMSKDFKILSSATPSSVKVTADYVKESPFQIQNNVVYKVADGYYASTALSAQTVNISGPQTKVMSIDKVATVEVIDGTLDKDTTSTVELILYDKSGKEINQSLLTLDVTSVEAKITILPEKMFNIIPTFVNKPSGLTITDDMISIEPNNINLAGPNEALEKIQKLSLESVDFLTLKNEKATFELGIDIPKDCVSISNTSIAKVTIDLSSFASKTIKVSNFTVEGLNEEKYSAKVTQNSLQVTVVGPKSQIDELKEGMITGVIDTSASSGTIGSVQMPVRFTISGANSCWVYGDYNASLTISEK